MRMKASAVASIALSVLLLSACDMSTPSKVHTGEIQVRDVMKTVTIDPTIINPDSVDIILSDYRQNGEGPMRLVVPYAPGNPLNKAAAQAQGERYKHTFQGRGVKDFRVSYTATVNPEAMGVLSYEALAAEPPRNCHHMPGFNGGDRVDDAEGRNYGCEMQTAISQMMARPADLLGQDGLPEDDAKRQGGLVEKYRSGVVNPALVGLKASGT